MQRGPTLPDTSDIAALHNVKQKVAANAYFNQAFLFAGAVYLVGFFGV